MHFIGITAIQIFYYLGIFSRFAFPKIQPNNPKKVPVSIIVCAKNEEENVKKLVPLLLEQNYPDFQIVLINDASSDNTLEHFEEYPLCPLIVALLGSINDS